MNQFTPTLELFERLPSFVLGNLPPELQDAIATLRRARLEAMDQIERLIAFLDETEFDIQEGEIDRMLAERFGEGMVDEDLEDEHDGREPDVDDEDGRDDEPSLGSSENVCQSIWGHHSSVGEVDLELDDSDLEPSLCGVSVERTGDRDLEADLGTFDRMLDQTKSTRTRFDRSGQPPVHDGEVPEVVLAS